MRPKQPLKSCLQCKHIKDNGGSDDFLCAVALDLGGARYEPLVTVKYQRASGWPQDCGPGARYFEPREA